MDYIHIGSTPTEEDCLGVGNPLARKEVQLFRDQLEREFPDGDFRLKACPHDFGTYYEVVAYYDELNDAQRNAAFAAEGDSNPLWDDIAAPLVAALRAEAA